MESDPIDYSRLRWAAACAAVLLAGACGVPGEGHLGGEWYVRDVPANTRRHVDAHRNLVRKWNGVSIVVTSFIGPTYRYYEPNCAMYEWMPSEMPKFAFREVWLVCGDHFPARVAFVSRQGARMDADGLRPAPDVEMRANSGVLGPRYDNEPKDFIPFAPMRAWAEQQPKNTRGIDPALKRANHAVVGALLFILTAVALVMRAYRRFARGL